LMAMRALALTIAFEQMSTLYSVSPRSLTNWIRRFNQQNIDGLIEWARSRRPPKIIQEQSAHYCNFYLKVPQLWLARQNEEKLYLEQLRAYLRNAAIDSWYLDEMAIEGDPRPRRRGTQKGSKVRVPHYGSLINRMTIKGLALCNIHLMTTQSFFIRN
jgi:hypothetical protein